MKVNEYWVLDRAVEEGVNCGYRRAHKHTESPDPTYLRDQIQAEVMNAICEAFEFTTEQDILLRDAPAVTDSEQVDE